MLTSTGSRLLRFLLLLVIRLRLSVKRIALAFRARFASLWTSILTFAPRIGSSGSSRKVRLIANDVPVANNSPVAEHPQPSGREKVEEEGSGTLAALPVRRPARWEDELAKYKDPTSSDRFEFDPLAHPATPDGGSQRYKARRLG